ncbi:hypothetical protein AgCh_024850 [Apium graveolens]
MTPRTMKWFLFRWNGIAHPHKKKERDKNSSDKKSSPFSFLRSSDDTIQSFSDLRFPKLKVAEESWLKTRKKARPNIRDGRPNDSGWKYAYYSFPETNKDVVKCILCGNSNHGGINLYKQHLIGGHPYIVKCPKTTKEIAKEMSYYMGSKKKRSRKNTQHQQIEENTDDDVQEIPSTASNMVQSSKSCAGTKGKAAGQPFNFKIPAASTKSAISMK